MKSKIDYKKTNFKYLFFLFTLCVIGLDQTSKFYAKTLLDPVTPIQINDYSNLILVFNQGIAFSLFSQQNTLQRYFLIIVPLLIIIYLIYYIIKLNYTFFNGLAYSLILGGAIGNILDRIIFNKVTDFIDWHIGIHHWPTFNIADSFVCIGVTMIIIDTLLNNGS